MPGVQTPDVHMYFYAAGDAMTKIVEAVRVKLTEMLLPHASAPRHAADG